MTGKEKVLLVLNDRQWHSYYDLLQAYYKFTQRLFDLRKDGYEIEERPNRMNKHALDYRLSHVPNQTTPDAYRVQTTFLTDNHFTAA